MSLQPHLVEPQESFAIRVRGRVQGVGFRPTVWRFARDLALSGEVLNDAEGVLIRVNGARAAVDALIGRLHREPPPLARIDSVETWPIAEVAADGFSVVESAPGAAHTQVAPDALVCAACAAEIADPFSRRYRYPFTNCTHCGPRFSIVRGIPYDRVTTTMAPFGLCTDCLAEYRDPADRRFQAQAIACHACGPRARLVRLDGRAVSFEQHSMLDDVDAVCSLLQKGEIVAIKGLGGYHLACDATRADVVARLRERKRRHAKPFALMARDLDIVRRYCSVDAAEAAALASPEAPIVLLRADGPARLPEAVAPGLGLLGFMLPTTPLHRLILRRMERPVVMTSGNLSDEPQVTDDVAARERLGGIAAFALMHDRAIANRVDDSVVRLSGGAIRVLRRARGFAPAPIALPPGFESAPPVLAYGGELKATFCLLKDGEAIVSQHIGDLEEGAAFDDYGRNLELYAHLFDHAPAVLAADRHPEYLSTKQALARAAAEALPLAQVQHHHAHVAACLAENGRPLEAAPVLGIVLDGLGYGDDGAIWGGEFLLADYRGYQRLGTLKPVAMPGGAQAAREPWRNLYAHLMAEMGWPAFAMNFAELEVYQALSQRPRASFDAMIRDGRFAPRASSCGRLFDAVAAALGLCRDRQAYEGQAAMMLEASVDAQALADEDEALAYPFTIPLLPETRMPYLEPLAMWNALLGDLILKTPPGVIAARFHRGLAKGVAAMADKLAGGEGEVRRFDTVALSGGCFQNRVLFEEVARRLVAQGFQVLSHARVPANDGGLALGQAAVAAALSIGDRPCA
ncbi:carbamoyltransferase HypF [Oleomonas cavernae]|uniref:Carbamoyltransferase HypF n=1 Tax=Oleomonas cavernae TaxID=2320859 RepID=A0A418W8R0_9PROT|nr:carbamoyltransferase HypF [Oleomonas cavernae]RJF86399.1 carbamoyltransferase HypF [Oleomonas cavernae]